MAYDMRTHLPPGSCWLILLIALAATESVAGAKLKKNVLFIAVDDLRVELGCYGNTIVKSPNIDKLATRGTVFTRAYCQQAVCNPSRASLLTGLRPSTLGIWDLPTHFRQKIPNVVTLPQSFKQQGYFTQNIGKIFHNWRQDDYRGDALSWSVPASLHYNTHGADNPQVKGNVPPNLVNVPRCEMREVADGAYFDGRVAEGAVKALRELNEKQQPFFFAVGFWKPHAAFNPPKKYWDFYKRSEIAPPPNPLPGSLRIRKWRRRRCLGPLFMKSKTFILHCTPCDTVLGSILDRFWDHFSIPYCCRH